MKQQPKVFPMLADQQDPGQYSWRIRIEAERLDLMALQAEARAAGFEVVLDGEEAPYLRGAEFDDLAHDGEVMPAARRAVELLNGLARVRHPDHRPVEVSGTILKVHPDGRHGVIIETPAGHARFRSHAPTVRAGAEDEGPEPRPDAGCKRYGLAQQSAALGDALRAFCGEPTWQKLRYVFEAIGQDVGGAGGMHRRGWATPEETGQFLANATDRRLSGRDALHGREFPHPPKADPMSLTEATRLVGRLLGRWMDETPR
jgi:hypothetical protein